LSFVAAYLTIESNLDKSKNFRSAGYYVMVLFSVDDVAAAFVGVGAVVVVVAVATEITELDQ